MTTLQQNTPTLWAGTNPNNTSDDDVPWNGSVGATINQGDPGEGWCNFNDQSTLTRWAARISGRFVTST